MHRVKFSDGRRRRQTSDGRLPLELGSDRRETSATRVSDDLQIAIFSRRKNFFGKNFRFFFRFSIIFGRFPRTRAFSDVKIDFLMIFRFRWSKS